MKNILIEYSNDTIIEIFDDFAFTVNSTDNVQKYNFEYFSDDSNEYTSRHGIFLRNKTTILNSVILLGSGGCTGIHENSYCIDDNVIILCCGDSLFSLTLPEFKLNWQIKIDSATAFGIHKMKNDYIVHGEFEISRINKYGKIVWQKTGSDIFTTIDGKNVFKIIENYICVKSWDGREYKFSYNGYEEDSNN